MIVWSTTYHMYWFRPLFRMYRLTSSTIAAIASINFNFTLSALMWNYEMNFNRSDVVDAFMSASATATALSCSFVLPQVLIVLQRPWWNHLRARVASSQGVLFKSYLVNSLFSYFCAGPHSDPIYFDTSGNMIPLLIPSKPLSHRLRERPTLPFGLSTLN